MATNPYTKYKQRLFGQMQENPELNLMNQSIAGLSTPFQELNNQLQSALRQGNASPGAKVAAAVRGSQQLQDERSALFSTALQNMTQRRSAIMGQISDFSVKEAEWDEQNAEIESDKKTKALRAGLQIGGMAVGAIVGTIVAPGAGTMQGAKIGAAGGQFLGGFVGIDKNGDLTVKPEQFDVDQIMQGAAGVLGTFEGMANEKRINEMSKQMAKDMGSKNWTQGIKDMSEEEWAMLYPQITGAIARGDMDTYNQLMSSVTDRGARLRAQGMVGDRGALAANLKGLPDVSVEFEDMGEVKEQMPSVQFDDVPTPDEIIRNVESADTDTAFATLIANEPQAKAYQTIYDKYTTMTPEEFDKWFAAKGYKQGTKQKFLRLYNSASGGSQ